MTNMSTRKNAIRAQILLIIVAASPLALMTNQVTAQVQPVSNSVFKLARASIPIDIPLAKGYENGNEIFFIATDASDEKIAEQATKLL